MRIGIRRGLFLLNVFVLLLFCATTVGAAKKKKSKRKSPAPQEDACDLTCGRGAKLNRNACRCVCQKGYKYDQLWERCADIDECAENEGKCQGTCYNSIGSFECRCGIGYILHSDSWQCLPEPRFVPCKALACYDGARLKVRKCECQCPSGLWYDFVEEKCKDYNECEIGEHGCDFCMNFHGGYSCYCTEDYEMNEDNTTCREAPYKSAAELACDSKTCGGGAALNLGHCECLCNDGYYYDESTESCIDINECLYEYCGGVCTNGPGYYSCECPEDMELASNGNCDPIPTLPANALQCQAHELPCEDGSKCYYESTICDGYPDCDDGTDERDCKTLCYPGQFACANDHGCLDIWLKCNGENDCGDNSDELECGCVDHNAKCPSWAIRDECRLNPSYMQTTCRLSCEYCIEGDVTASGTLTLKENPDLYFLRNSESYAKYTQYILRNTGRRQGKSRNSWQCSHVTDVPKDVRNGFRLSSFYSKYTMAYGIPVLGSSRVSDEAMRRACYVVRVMLSDSRVTRQAMFERYIRVAVIADSEVTRNIPEYSHLPAEYSDLVRGLGATLHIPVVSVGEENLLCQRTDINKKEDILVRNLAHAIHKLGILPTDTIRKFEFALEKAYTHARRSQLWSRTVVDDTADSYFAEGVQSFFNAQAPAKSGIQNDVDTRAKLRYYDPELYSIMNEVFFCQNKLVDRCEDQAHIASQDIRMNCEAPIRAPVIQNRTFVPEYDPSCQDQHESCERWMERNECTNNPLWMSENCPRSCKTCPVINKPQTEPPGTSEDEDCQDSDENCAAWADRGECEANPAWMRPNCARSCRTCGENPHCFDNNELCPEWASNGSCEENPGYMGLYCQRSCNIC